ncbi:putative LuxR-family transcriptional regulator [Actinoplanes missouriensis 431]|uniref:Putative LuxR-family transcriptional regulator n=1 Tax=Actinoplanes missouriensis (strain ATCC 14538 / DSM 43046 / CBS 188.64 / JCM 3121 / NBRC 102363 / NCIMB 12654 / NRRL B-3342 / UNCC 431) TaxID=512565 RepID=I0GYS2_ACTM4|nr:response regulator transcription factor [Actinoplanes missouriensis]BAL85909.1 putative LuxR-family transcriptional regulator [Actinoplanes missouriensis 431]
MRTVLVCVRTPLAAQTVASTAARLGMTGVVRTAVSETEAMIRLAERPAEVVLADTAVTRPDSVGFTRRVLARAPQAQVVLFGAEDPRVAAAAVAAGARGVIRGVEHDLVSVVAKALLLLLLPVRPQGMPINGANAQPATVAGGARNNNSPGTRGQYHNGPGGMGVQNAAAVPAMLGPNAPMVPAQRGDAPIDPATGRPMVAWPGNEAGMAEAAPQGRRLTLTERELQVLRGMADGKSNAEIGRELFVSEDTVKTHARRLFRKLGARDRAHAVAAGFRAGLVA